MIRFGAVATAILLTASAASAAGKGAQTPSLLPGGDSRQPVSIEADKLVYSDKEQKATYSGNVVVIQGDSKLTCSVMVVTLEKGGSAASAPATGEAAAGGTSGGVRHMDCSGPVSMLSKEQTATADSAAYDKSQNKVWLIGHVALSNDGNVTKGDRLVYDLTSGQATVESAGGAKGARVSGQFLPGSAPAKDAPSPKASEAARKPKS